MLRAIDIDDGTVLSAGKTAENAKSEMTRTAPFYADPSEFRPGLLALPGEDPAELRTFVAEVAASLNPVGRAEQQLAAQFAIALWRVGRRDLWEALAARKRAVERERDLPSRPLGLSLAELLKDTGATVTGIAENRRAIALMDAIDNTPEADQVAAAIAGHIIETAYMVCPLPQIDEKTLRFEAQILCEDLDDLGRPVDTIPTAPWYKRFYWRIARKIGIPEKFVHVPFTWPGWSVGSIRKVFDFKAASAAIDAARLKKLTRSFLRKEIRRLEAQAKEKADIDRSEYQSQFLLVAIGDDRQADVIRMYEAEALRTADRCLSMLLRLQEARRKVESEETNSDARRKHRN